MNFKSDTTGRGSCKSNLSTKQWNVIYKGEVPFWKQTET